jgi:hypothetical protein
MKENEMDGTSIHACGNEKCVENLPGILKGRYQLRDLGIDGRIILKHKLGN